MPINEREYLKQAINANQQEIFVLSVEQMDKTIQANKHKLNEVDLKAWEIFKDPANAVANYTSVVDDLKLLQRLVKDLGSVGAKASVKTINGKPHIILKGYPGLREVLTSPKYGIKNAKVIKMGLGRTGAVHAAKGGGIITIVLLTSYRVADYVLTDQATLSELLGTIATDVVKVGLGVGASILAASAVAAMTTIAIGPLVAAIAVGVVASWALDKLDQEFDITESVIDGLDALAILAKNKKQEIEDNIQHKIDQTERALSEAAMQVLQAVMDEVVETSVELLEKEARKTLRRLINVIPAPY
jgi:hypothetical protein